MAKVAKTAGGFYRDMRMLNLSVAESKLEAGMVRNQLISVTVQLIFIQD